MSTLTVKLPDGSARELASGSTAADLAASIGSRLAKAALAAVVDGSEADLSAPLPEGATVAIITADSDAGRHVLRHSTAHVLAQAVTQLFPGAKFSIGPAIEDGFYYDFDLPGGRTFSETDLASITDKMREIVKADQPFVRSEVGVDEALRLFADQPYKCRSSSVSHRAQPMVPTPARLVVARPSASTATPNRSSTFVVDLTCRPPAGSATSPS